ncbi:IclR family transcriptional regulator [Flavobacterium saccharophilum]|uniref:Transcriptional regulator, IclR family n=1 Tax=Flavobacterium saccharophilum TaxID=29534 RepID=A0A1M7JIR2_9FLAO|nr:IclR family transcriptional regulator [Flavobacterium saccharophilum]SHM52836.1 transcriptional regulator, IclR family [Flavobacterium saccharophilum]
MTVEQLVKYNAPALDKGLDILEFLSAEGTPQSQAEIAQGIKKTPSEIYRMLVCLEERGYLIRGTNAGKYRLSLKMYSLSHRHTPFDELKRVAHYPMQNLSEKIKQSCHLSIINNDQLLIIAQMRSPNAVSLSIEEGTHFPLALTTSGRVFLSLFTDEQRNDFLNRDIHYSKWSTKEQKEFVASILQVQKDGYRYAQSKITSGITDFAVPVGLHDSDLQAVLAVSVFTSSIDNEISNEQIINALKEAQAEINKLIGG